MSSTIGPPPPPKSAGMMGFPTRNNRIPESQTIETIFDDGESSAVQSPSAIASPPTVIYESNASGKRGPGPVHMEDKLNANGLESGVTLTAANLVDKSTRPAPYANVGVSKSPSDRVDEEIRC